MKQMKGGARVQEAFVTLRQMPGTRVWFWVVDDCPLCGARHVHPAGGLRDDPEERLGEVPAPCTPGASYRLGLPPKPRQRGGKRAQHRRERREGRRNQKGED